MDNGATLAVTLDFEELGDIRTEEVEASDKPWGKLISLNPNFPSVDLSGKFLFTRKHFSCLNLLLRRK